MSENPAWLEIDRAFATPEGVFVPWTAVRDPVDLGDVVNVRERGSGKYGGALVVAIDDDNVYLSLAWNTLTHPAGGYLRGPIVTAEQYERAQSMYLGPIMTAEEYKRAREDCDPRDS